MVRQAHHVPYWGHHVPLTGHPEPVEGWTKIYD